MIHDLLSHAGLYRVPGTRMALGFDWLLRFDPSTPDGRHSVSGDEVFAIVQSYETAAASTKQLETHRDHIDIQYIISGQEVMQCVGAGELVPVTEYDPARDVRFYSDPAARTSILCGPGSFTVFWTHDAHKGGCLAGAPSRVRKVVIKVRV